MAAIIGIFGEESALERVRDLVSFFGFFGSGGGRGQGRGRGFGRLGVHRHGGRGCRFRRTGLLRLSELQENQIGLVKEVHCPGPVRRRLLDMGIVPGVRLLMERRAPLGDPIEVKCKTFHISLRLEEAHGILVEVEGETEGEAES